LTVTTASVFDDYDTQAQNQSMRRHPPPYARNDDDGVVISGEQREPNLTRRILRWFGGAFLWLLALAPGSYIFAKGVGGKVNKWLAGRRNWHVLYGVDAIGFGWVTVGVGFWALGQFCYLKTSRPAVKFVDWTLAVLAGVIGVWVLLKGSGNSTG